MTIEAATDGDVFLAYLKEVLCPQLAGVSHGEEEKDGIRRRMNGIALACRIYHAFGQSNGGQRVKSFH